MTVRTAAPTDWTKLEKLQYLLDQWDAIFDPSATSSAPGDGTGVPLMPLMARHPSVLELARCLTLLFTACPGDYRHLKTYRVGCEWRLRDVDARFRLPSGKWTTVKRRERQRIVPAWLDMARVTRGEEWVSGRYRGEPFIPDELWIALTKPLEIAV